MKKLLIIMILLIPLILCSCEKKEYSLIEITAEELVNNLNSDNNFVFAIIDYSEDDTEQFLKDLKSITKNSNMNIYYVDYLHIDTSSSFELFNLYSTDFTTNGYHVIQNQSLIVSNEYTNFKELFTALKGKNFTSKLDLIDEKTKKSHIKEAKTLYEDNKISESYDMLCKAWDLKEAKEFLENNKYYKLINIWERTEITDEVPEKTNYTFLGFYTGVNYYTYHEKTSLSEKFDNKISLNEMEIIYYRIKDDIILTSNREDGYYEETYKIVDVNDQYLQITDLKTKENKVFTRRNDV